MLPNKTSLQATNVDPLGRRARRRAEMRARLLAAALELFADRGYTETTIDDIAQRADVARQTVLNHFPRKRDFSLAWGETRRERLTEIEASASPRASTRTLLHRYYAALAQMNERERTLTRVIHSSVTLSDGLSTRPVADAVVATLVRGQSRGEVRPGISADTAAEVITAVYFDTLNRWLTEGNPPFTLQAELARRLDLVLVGLSPPA